MLIIQFSSTFMMTLKLKYHNLKFSFVLFSLFFIIFLFTSDGHRFTFDEDVASQQSKRIASFSPDPSFVLGESRQFFEYPWLFPPEFNKRPICQNAILCSQATIIHSLTQVPFILINNQSSLLVSSDIWTTDDFDDFHYVAWRNNAEPNLTFMEIFYGPFFSALSVFVFFLISKTYNYSMRICLTLVFLYGLSTMLWAYSQTSLNAIPFTFFVLTGFLFYRKFKKTNSHFNFVLTGIFFGISFLTRNDMILIIIPFFIYLLITLFQKNEKLKTFFAFIIPITSSYVIHKIIEYVRVGVSENPSTVSTLPKNLANAAVSNPYHIHIFGILFSPGAGLFIYSPILFACIVGFFDFYKKNKPDCILFLSIVAFFILFFSAGNNWHGFNGWGPRYLLPIIPFLIFPIGASIEKRTNIFFKLSLVLLGIFGAIINLIYILQDVSWFVWGFFGSDERGLYSLARKADGSVHDLWVNPVIIWTFEYGQILQSLLWLISKPQLDLFLLKIFGPELFALIFVLLIGCLSYFLLKFSKIFVNLKKNT